NIGRPPSICSGPASAPARRGRPRPSARMTPMAALASFANRRTMPTVVRPSKIASRMASSSTAVTWMFSLIPWWKSMVNSGSPMRRAIAAVELKAPAARADSETVSSERSGPPWARSWPPRSMSSASTAADSARKFRRTPLIRRAASSWMASSCVLIPCPLLLREPADQHHAGHRVELELGHEVSHRHRRHGQEVEEERPLVPGGERDQVAAVRVGQAAVDVLQVRRLADDARAVVDDLEADLPLRVVDDGHGVV